MVLIVLGSVFAITLLMGVPIAFCLGLSSLAVVLFKGEYSIFLVAQKIFNGMDMFSLMAIPLFILAGDLMNLGGVTDRLIRFSNLLVDISGEALPTPWWWRKCFCPVSPDRPWPMPPPWERS